MAAEHSGSPTALLIRAFVFAFLLGACLSIILSFHFLPARHTIHVGEAAAQTIKSPVRITFTSASKTEEKRSQAASLIADIFVYDEEVRQGQLAQLSQLSQQLTAVRQAQDVTPSQKIQRIAETAPISPTEASSILQFSDEQWLAVLTETRRLVAGAMQEQIPPEQVEAVKERVGLQINASLSRPQSDVVAALVANFIAPNLLFDKEATQQARQAARDAVQPVLVAVAKGETILRDGEIVTQLHLEKLEAAGLLTPKIKTESIAALSLLCVLVSLLLAIYILIFQPTLLLNHRRLALVGVVMLVGVLAAKLTVPDRELYAYLFPAAAAPMLIATLLDAQLAIIVAVTLAPLLSYIAGGSLELLMLYLLGGVAGILGVWKAPRLDRFFVAGAAVVAVNVAVILAFWWLSPERELARLGTLGLVAIINGALAAALTVGTFTALGYLFGITTIVHLMELARPTHPLLRRLLMEAPGTYNHSILVGNLAERAAETIGADSLLVRVGSYYHDIGKLLRPGYFTENQIENSNPHDALEPEASARIVVSHVTDGLRLAEEHRLPNKIRDFIGEHHGDRFASFFYQQATEKGKTPDPADFRYPGPRPQSKETAIVMLADAAEAVARASPDHSPEEIDRLVEKVVADRMAEGMLAQCDLTLRDIEGIKEAFKGILKGLYHPRLEYPTPADQAAPS